MSRLDPDELFALRKSRAAFKRLRGAVKSIQVAGGWWEDTDNFLCGAHDLLASEVRDRLVALEEAMDESYPKLRRQARTAQ